jgi:hypothetical protein
MGCFSKVAKLATMDEENFSSPVVVKNFRPVRVKVLMVCGITVMLLGGGLVLYSGLGVQGRHKLCNQVFGFFGKAGVLYGKKVCPLPQQSGAGDQVGLRPAELVLDVSRLLGKLKPLYQAQTAAMTLDRLGVVLEVQAASKDQSKNQSKGQAVGQTKDQSKNQPNAPFGTGAQGESALAPPGPTDTFLGAGGALSRQDVLIDQFNQLTPEKRQAVEKLYRERQTLRSILNRFVDLPNTPRFEEVLSALRAMEASEKISFEEVLFRLDQLQDIMQDQDQEKLAKAQKDLDAFMQTHQEALGFVRQVGRVNQGLPTRRCPAAGHDHHGDHPQSDF